MSLNLNDRPQNTASGYCTSAAFTDAVNDARFVKTFGVLAGISAVITLLFTFLTGLFIGGSSILIGVGLAVMGFGKSRFYRVLGLSVAISGFFSLLISLLILTAGICFKGLSVLSSISEEGKGDPDWLATRNRALTGVIASALGGTIGAIWLGLGILSMFL
jgi:hypothetical protein